MSLSCGNSRSLVRGGAVGAATGVSWPAWLRFVPARPDRNRGTDSRERGDSARSNEDRLSARSGRDPRVSGGVSIGSGRRILGIALVVIVCALFDAVGPVRSDSNVVEQFLEHYLTGCVRQSGTRGHDRLQGHAWCTCAVAQLRMEGSEAELEELARRVARGESITEQGIFNRAVRSRAQCDALGTHDALPPARLDRSKDFGPFTIALPPGFLMLTRATTPDRASYGFHRLHQDLRSAATLQVVIARASRDRWSGPDADEFRLRSLLDELGSSRANLRVVESGEWAAGNLRFERARWEATEAGDPIVGEAYAGSSRESVVLIRLQDQERFAASTMSAMRAALETLRLR